MLSIVIPTLNEVESLKELLPRLFSPDLEVIICDNGSTDGTVRLVEDARVNFDVRLSKGTGTVTDAILRGIREAYYDNIVVMDGDGSHPSQIVSRLVSALDGKDMVVGSRYCKGGKNKDSLRNRIISRGFNLLTYSLAPKISDRASGFWAIKKSRFTFPIRNTVKPVLECLVRGKMSNVVEVPYTFEPRKLGKTKHNRSTLVLRTLWDIFLLYAAKFRVFNYMVVGGICFLINLGIYYPLTLVYQERVVFLNQIYYLPPFVVSTFIAGTIHYLMNKFWTFGDRKEGSLGFFRYWAVLGPTILIDMVIIFLLVQYLNLVPVAAVAITLLLVFMVRYTIANKWIWSNPR